MKDWNLIGFNFPSSSMIDPSRWKHCVIHPGCRLVSKLDEPGVLFCPLCGWFYEPKYTISQENFEPTVNPKSQTKIITPKKKKKQYDSEGYEINDEQLLKDIAKGIKVISYNEHKVEGVQRNPSILTFENNVT